MKRLLLAVLVAAAACKSKPREAPPPAPVKPAEPAKPAAPVASADADKQFWAWFSEHAAALHDDKDLQHVMETISAEIEKIHPGVFAEIGGGDGDRTLVLSADGIKDLFPAVQALHAARPTAVPGWKIVAFRQRDPQAGMVIEMAGKKLDPAHMKFVAEPGGGKVDVTIYVPGFTTADEMGQALFIVLDHTVGEYDMETKIAGIDFAGIEQAPAEAHLLSELPTVLDALPAP